MPSTPDTNLTRRLASLEQMVSDLSYRLSQVTEQRTSQTTPLSSRLWIAELNEAMGATTSGEADADLLNVDAADTSLDITIEDPLDAMIGAPSGQQVLCLEQISMDGARHFIAVTSGSLISFTLGKIKSAGGIASGATGYVQAWTDGWADETEDPQVQVKNYLSVDLPVDTKVRWFHVGNWDYQFVEPIDLTLC